MNLPDWMPPLPPRWDGEPVVRDGWMNFQPFVWTEESMREYARAAYRAGAEAMREKAAQLAEGQGTVGYCDPGLAKHIRDLPLDEKAK